jgi:hypothetical protein
MRYSNAKREAGAPQAIDAPDAGVKMRNSLELQ